MFSNPAMASQNNIRVILNGAELSFDVSPQIINNRAMVPMRSIFEAMGANVDWNSDTQAITATKGDTVITMRIGNLSMLVNGREYSIDVPPMLIDGRTLVPLRAVSDGLDAEIEWDQGTRTVIIKDENIPTAITSTRYMDEMLRMHVVVNNANWTFYKEREPEQVFFYNNVNRAEENLISISAIPFSGNATRQIGQLWEEMRSNHRTSIDYSFEYKDRIAIQVGVNKYPGFKYSFEVKSGGETILVCNALFWSANGMIYICTTSANVQGVQEVQDVLDGLLESFTSI